MTRLLPNRVDFSTLCWPLRLRNFQSQQTLEWMSSKWFSFARSDSVLLEVYFVEIEMFKLALIISVLLSVPAQASQVRANYCAAKLSSASTNCLLIHQLRQHQFAGAAILPASKSSAFLLSKPRCFVLCAEMNSSRSCCSRASTNPRYARQIHRSERG